MGAPVAMVMVSQCDGPPMDLHSFPTRRSSDLSLLRTQRGGGRRDRREQSRPQRERLLRRTPEPPLSRRRRDAGLADRREDRKSTRLNSSHSQISYAVFRLKKKVRLADDALRGR